MFYKSGEVNRKKRGKWEENEGREREEERERWKKEIKNFRVKERGEERRTSENLGQYYL